MPGMLRKMGEYFGFAGPEYELDDEYADEYGGEYAEPYGSAPRGYSEPSYNDEPEHAAAQPRRFSSTVHVQQPRPTARERHAEREPQRQMAHREEREPRRQAPAPAQPSVRITTIHPKSYNDAKQVGELVRQGQAVIMNLSEMADDLARRLVDFGAGLTFGLGGSIDRVTARVFLMSPPNVSVSAEDRARIAEGGFFNQS